MSNAQDEDDQKSIDSVIDNIVEIKKHCMNTKKTVGRINTLKSAKLNLNMYLHTLEDKLK